MACIFHARFHRYGKKTAESRISGVRHINATTFAEAFARANDLLTGMRDAAPEYEYSIVEIGTHDYHGIDCGGGGNLFETAEEFSARIAQPAVEPA